jgi:hypothetical protein
MNEIDGKFRDSWGLSKLIVGLFPIITSEL